MAQMPDWCQRGNFLEPAGEIVDDGGWLESESSKTEASEKPDWSRFVADEIERFERHYAGEFKSSAEWSSIWRRGWWPKVTPAQRFPKSAPKEFQPFFRQGSPDFAAALKLGNKAEKRMWTMFGVAQFKPEDPRLAKLSAVKDKRK